MARTPGNVPYFSDLKIEVKDPHDTGTLTDIGGTGNGYQFTMSDGGEPDYFAEDSHPIYHPLGNVTEMLVVELKEFTAAVQALITPGATVTSSTVTHGGRNTRRIVGIQVTGTKVSGGAITVAWNKCAVIAQADMRWTPKEGFVCAVGFERLKDDSGSSSTTTHTAS